VLTDFPRSQAQAQALQRTGELVNHFILLEQPYERGVSTGSDELIAVQAYRRAVSQISPVFKNCVSVLDANRSKREVWTDIAELLNTPRISDAPRRPLRVCILGGRGSGKATQARTLAHKFGAVVISVGDILRREREKNSVAWQAAEPFYSAGMLVPDAVIVPLLEHRLLQQDCRQNGTILDGFPRTMGQVQALKAMKTVPNRVVVLDCDEKVSLERIVHRKVNPDTNEVFHENRAPAPASLASKLVHDPNDKVAVAMQINACIGEQLDTIVDAYEGIASRFQATVTTIGALNGKIERFVLASLSN
jgi:adenylate kinase